MRQSIVRISIVSWFTGGALLGLVEIIQLPKDPLYSVLLQLLPLLFLAGGIWVIIVEYQRLSSTGGRSSRSLRRVMDAGWVAVFGVNAGLASLNNFYSVIFSARQNLPFYFQGISLSQKVIALAGVFILGTVSVLTSRRNIGNAGVVVKHRIDFWEKPLTNIGFIAILAGVVLGLALYWSPIVYAGFFILLAGVMMYLIGRFTERDVDELEKEPGPGL